MFKKKKKNLKDCIQHILIMDSLPKEKQINLMFLHYGIYSHLHIYTPSFSQVYDVQHSIKIFNLVL